MLQTSSQLCILHSPGKCSLRQATMANRRRRAHQPPFEVPTTYLVVVGTAAQAQEDVAITMHTMHTTGINRGVEDIVQDP
jgi:hypothetical protein